MLCGPSLAERGIHVELWEALRIAGGASGNAIAGWPTALALKTHDTGGLIRRSTSLVSATGLSIINVARP